MNYTDSVPLALEKKRVKILTFGPPPPARGKTKTFLIGKELKTKDLLTIPRRNGQADRQQNPQNPG